jgi:hypothetical protein
MTDEQLEALILTTPHDKARHKQYVRLNNIREYLHIGGPSMTPRQAAERLGVTPEAVGRWRKILGEER